MSLRSPLSRARGLGAAKEGTHHWLLQRITAIAMVPLMLWLVFSLAALAGADHAAVTAWIGRPLNTALLLLVIGTLFYHAILGTQVVIEDYIGGEGGKMAALVASRFLLILAAVLGIVAVLQISLGA